MEFEPATIEHLRQIDITAKACALFLAWIVVDRLWIMFKSSVRSGDLS